MTPHDAEARERVVLPRHRGSGLAQWAAVLGPIAAAFMQQQLSYGLVTWACTRDIRFLVHLPTIGALIIVAASAIHGARHLQAAGPRFPEDERSSDARERYMAVLALLSSGFATLLVVAQWLPTVFIHPCQR